MEDVVVDSLPNLRKTLESWVAESLAGMQLPAEVAGDFFQLTAALFKKYQQEHGTERGRREGKARGFWLFAFAVVFVLFVVSSCFRQVANSLTFPGVRCHYFE